jgi:UDP-2-acetamido-2-deoxy-ribo-hexuluronate aminotransferase
MAIFDLYKIDTMRELKMVDLASQYDTIKTEVDQAISEVITNTSFINGPAVKNFQKDLESYLDVEHVIPCANGTDALQIAMMALELQPGDEVITASFTYVATAEVIALLKLVPVLVDVDPNTFMINVDQVKAAIGPKTKAIVPVHLFGQSAPMHDLMQIAKEHNLYVIEDTAQAIGSEYTFPDGTKMKSGTIGHIGATSFFPSKNLGCFGDGGAIFTRDENLAKKIRMIANHGQSIQYYHDEIGVNSRLDSIQAAILGVKLKNLDKYSSARQSAADFYDQAFAGIPELQTPARVSNSTHVFHQYTLRLKGLSRDLLVTNLREKGLPVMVYYPVPLHEQKAYQQEGSYPITEMLCKEVFSLPMHTELDQEQLDFITKTVIETITQLRIKQ